MNVRLSIIVGVIALLALTACAPEARFLPSICRLDVDQASKSTFQCQSFRSTTQGVSISVTPMCNTQLAADCPSTQDYKIKVSGACNDELQGLSGTVCANSGFSAGQRIELKLELSYAEAGVAGRKTVMGELSDRVE